MDSLTLKPKAMTIRSIVLVIFATLASGLLFALLILQEDSNTKLFIQQKVESALSEIIQAPFYCTVEQIDFLHATIRFKNLSSAAADKSWEFHCPTMTLDFSWLAVAMRSRIEAHLSFYHPRFFSQCDPDVKIAQPLRLLFETPATLPFVVRSSSFRQSVVRLVDQKHQLESQWYFSSESYPKNKGSRAAFFLSDGFLNQADRRLLDNLSGSIILSSQDNTTATLQLLSDVPLLGAQAEQMRLFCSFDSADNQGNFELSSKDELISCKGKLDVTKQPLLTYTLRAPLESINPLLSSSLAGICDLQGSVCFADSGMTYKATAAVAPFSFKNISCRSISCTVEGDAQQAHGLFDLQPDSFQFGGTFSYDLKQQKLQMQASNKERLELPGGFFIEKSKAHATLNTAPAAKSLVDATFAISHPNKETKKITTTCVIDSKLIKAQGKIAGAAYTFEIPFSTLLPTGKITSGKQTILILTPHKKRAKVELNLKSLQDLTTFLFGSSLAAEGAFKASIDYLDDPHIEFDMTQAHIRLGEIYNTLQELKGRIELDSANRCVKLKNIHCGLYKGSIDLIRGAVWFSPQGLSYLSCPLVLDDCLISWQKDFFGLISGNLTVFYDTTTQGSLSGNLFLDGAQLKKNIFSLESQKDMLQSRSAWAKHPVALDLKCVTKSPIEIKSPFVEGDAHIALTLAGTTAQPEYTGSIALERGTLLFPYKPLYIQSCTLLLNSQLVDPTIELVAKNKIKKYAITLRISGTSSQPRISFESFPELQDEQIITLLLAGSEQGSLYAAMSGILVHGVEQLLFGSYESSTKLQKTLKSLLKPLQNVRIMPALTETENGVKGGIEIDINDRLHALIQNNLTLTDDTHVEVEYALSDDVSLRGTKDEKGNVTGEIEMRWKF